MDYRLYVDEAGDHTTCVDEQAPVGSRFLGLVGVAVRRGDVYEAFCSALDGFKRQHLPYDPDDPPILHREDILNRRHAFRVLQDEARRSAFDNDLLGLIEDADFVVISVVVDKLTHGTKAYRKLQHPYHYCLLALLERYCGLLGHLGLRGDLLVEARGRREDKALEETFEEFFKHGGGATSLLTADLAQSTLTSRKPKVKSKLQNIPGLQLADLLAHPLTRDVLVSYDRIPDRGGPIADRNAAAVSAKYNRHLYQGRIQGYGRVILA
jgi:hypothetical protein